MIIVLGCVCLLAGVVIFGRADIPASHAVMVFLLHLAGFGAIVVGIGRGVTGRLGGFALSGRYFYSLSRLQMAGWTVIVIATLVTAAELRIFGTVVPVNQALDIEIPSELLIAMGIAVFTTAAAPALLSLRSSIDPGRSAKDAGEARAAAQTNAPAGTVGSQGVVLTRTDPAQARVRDMVIGDEVATAGVVDLSKVQQLLITLLLLCTYVGAVISWLHHASVAVPAETFGSLPKLSQSFVSLMAVSHAGYLGFKAIPKVAPDKPATP